MNSNITKLYELISKERVYSELPEYADKEFTTLLDYVEATGLTINQINEICFKTCNYKEAVAQAYFTCGFKTAMGLLTGGMTNGMFENLGL